MFETDLGEIALFENEEVFLELPIKMELYESKKKQKLGKPKRNRGSGAKYVVFVKNPSTGRVKKITYGDKKGGLEGNWNDSDARKSFAARHKCAKKTNKLTAGYWACRAHKDFGKDVPGRFW